jgi:putative peptidoglycan lipid II flippase
MMVRMTDAGPDGELPGDRRPADTDRPRPPAASRRPLTGFGRFLQRSGRPTRTLLGAASIVALGFLLSRLLGVVRTVAIANAFGTEPELAAYWVAFRLPDLVFQVLAGATLSAAFIPIFSRTLLRRGEEEAWHLASSVLNLVALATFVLAALAFMLAPWIVPWFAPDLGVLIGREEELKSEAVQLTRLMLISPLFFGISGMFMGILNARQHFVAPAFAPVIYNLSIIGGAVFLADRLGVYGLAWGVVIGAAGHMLVQIPALRSVGMRWSPSFDVFSAGVQDVLRLMGPRVLGLASNQINLLALVFFASFVSEEAISAINYTFLIVMLPVGVVGMAISTAAFPTLAQQAAAGEGLRLRASITRALRMILFLAIPASAGLIVLAEPGVRVLLERGAFDAVATELVAGALVVYALSVTAQSGVEILSRGFYALEDTRTPVAIAILAMVVNIVFAALMVGPFGLRGLAGAATIAATLEFALLVAFLRNRIGGFEVLPLRRTIGSTVIGTIVLVQVVIVVRLLLTAAGLDGDTFLGAAGRIVLAGGLGLLAFLAVTYTLNRDDYAVVTGARRGR